MTWTQVCFRVIGFYLAFLVPSAILVAVVILKRIKLTPTIIAVGFGITVFIGVLILLVMDPRSRQYSWITIVTIALFLGLLGILGPLVTQHLRTTLGLPHLDNTAKAMLARIEHSTANSLGEKDKNVKPTEHSETHS